MTFYFSVYSTPLLFGFVQGWLYAILLWVRGYREERLSDKLLGGVLVALCFEIWVYMLGFGGIEILWRQLEFFPRDLGYLLGPLIYFYLKSQFDSTFRFRLRDSWHALLFVIHWVYHITVFAQGPAFVQQWETHVHNPFQIGNIEFVVLLLQQYVYLYLSFQLYRGYRQWIKHQFSETDTISFRWYRNFLIALITTATISLIVTLVDLWLDLSFWQDWWGNLAAVVLIYYVSIEGYAQTQLTRKLIFKPELIRNELVMPESPDSAPVEEGDLEFVRQPNVPALSAADQVKGAVLLPDLPERLSTLLSFMASEKPYLEPDLALPDLARRMHTNPVLLSQVINAGAGKNFNDFVNEYRVDEFKRQVRDPANAHLSFLGLALDCGFNSKATFNRAFKKFTGRSPKEFTA